MTQTFEIFFSVKKLKMTLFIMILSLLMGSQSMGQNIQENLIDPLESTKYEPSWPSLDARPLPAWFDEGKVGIFIHWGVFSVPGFGDAWLWYNWKMNKAEETSFMKKNYRPDFTYQEFASQFTAEFYDPYQWAELFQKAGARYIVLTTKHHEGYTLWPSKYSFGWNALDVGPNRDLVGDLANAVRNRTKLRFGLYQSRYEFFNPLYLSDKKALFTQDEFVRQKALPELYDIVNRYQPEVIWSDGEWEATANYWKAKEFIAWLYNDSPVKDTVVINDRWGWLTKCAHGGFYTCQDRYNPGVLQTHKWENCMTLDKQSWGIRKNANIQDYLSPQELVQTLVQTVACGGNLLVNVGPTRDGMIIPVQQERLLQLGEWLEINGNAIYESTPWTVQNDTETSGVWYTTNVKRNQIYAIVLNWPAGHQLHLASVNSTIVQSVGLLGFSKGLPWTKASPAEGINVTFPRPSKTMSKWAWTVVINQKI